MHRLPQYKAGTPTRTKRFVLPFRVTSGILALMLCATSDLPAAAGAWSDPYTLEVFPTERAEILDPETDARVTFVTTHEAQDSNLYFYHRSWLSDESVLLFYSERASGGLMGYLEATGELVSLRSSQGSLGGVTAARARPSFFALCGDRVLEVELSIQLSADPHTLRSVVTARERLIASIPPWKGRTALNENADGALLSIGMIDESSGEPVILLIAVKEGTLRELCRLPNASKYAGHVQWSRSNPHLLSFAGRSSESGDWAGPRPVSFGPEDFHNRRERLWVVDTRVGVPRNPYQALEGELVTHESWWREDEILFCGGTRREPGEESHVKTLNIQTGEARVVGPGYWHPESTPKENARWNWWHAAASEDNAWVVADNWHGDLMLFEGRTSRPHPLVRGHRVYGAGLHPHPGWDRVGKRVVFTSNLRGNADVCIAELPAELRALAGRQE